MGIHLPQYGRVAGPEAIRRAAVRAEELGFDDVWISDHVVHPADQSYPSPWLYDPFVTLAWAAAVTERVGLGTSVIVAPHHNPVWLANALASLDSLSGGRLTIAVGVGWSEAEYQALGQDFHNRGRRLDEIIDLLRAAWTEDPVTFEGEHYQLDRIRFRPPPAHDIPIWVGGSAEPAYRRACEKGDGFHAIGLDTDTVDAVVERIRQDRPEPEFTISLRTGWDAQGMDPKQIADERVAFAEAGIQHVVSAPWRDDLDDWLRSMELLAEICEVEPSA